MNWPWILAAVLALAGLAAGQTAPASAPADALAEARPLVERGQYDEALAALVSAADDDPAAHVLRAELQMTVGRHDEALASAERALELRPDWPPGILLAGRALETRGRTDDALARYRAIERVATQPAVRTDAEALTATGLVMDRLMTLTGQRASDQAGVILRNYLQSAYLDVDSQYVPARVATGLFLLRKHRQREAAEELAKALEINPDNPDALAGLATIGLEQWQFEQVEGLIDRGLAGNARHAGLLLLRAQLRMQQRKLDEAAEPIEAALAVNPDHLEALSLLAALRLRQDDAPAAAEAIARVEAVHQGPWPVMHRIIGEWLLAARQFGPAREHLERAVALAPQLAASWTELGLLHMQRGDEDMALAAFEKAHAIDNYRADVVNYINLLRRMERDFVTHETEHFFIRADGNLDRVLLERAGEYLESIHEELCATYDHEPPEKTLVEFFPTHTDFSLRLTGKAWVGTVGASTGRVIVLAAPHPQRSQMGTFLWPAVLRHEYTHTVTLSATRNRIPHWLTEALAVHEQPDRRDFSAVQALVEAVRADRLFTVRELDWGFIRPRRRGDRSLAYAQAQWIIEYITETHGDSAMRAMLAGFRDGLSQAAIFERVLGTTEEAFDSAFAAWARQQVQAWGFDPAGAPSLNEARSALQESPDSAAAHGQLARALLAAGQREQAVAAAERALTLDEDADALTVLALSALEADQGTRALEYAERLERARPGDPVAPRVQAQVYLGRQDAVRAIPALQTLQQRLPLDPYSYEQLARLYQHLGLDARALEQIEEIHRHNMTDPAWPRRIAELHRQLGQSDQAVAAYEALLSLNPYDTSVYQTLAALHLRAGRPEQALRAATDATLAAPELAEAWANLAAVCYRIGRASGDRETLRRGLDAADRALKLDPASPAQRVREALAQQLGDE